MQRVILSAAMLSVLFAGAAQAATGSVTINKIDENGVAAAVGSLALEDTPAGLKITPALTGLPPEEYARRRASASLAFTGNVS